MDISYNLKDSRLNDRLNFCLKKVNAHPSKSFPLIFNKQSELSAFYRLMNNKRIQYNDLLEPVFKATSQNLENKETITLVAHDTTEISPVSINKRYLAHLSLLLSPNIDDYSVYGVGNLYVWNRSVGSQKKFDSENERWFFCTNEVEKRFTTSNMIHLMDREGDCFTTLAKSIENDYRFVIRACNNRKLIEGGKSFDCVKTVDLDIYRDVFVSKRKKSVFPTTDKTYPPRKERKVRLKVRAKEIELMCPASRKKTHPHSIKLNIVNVEELDPPAGEKPIEWFLYTTESISTEEDILNIIDFYRKRWVIEEFFKGLKTGCQIKQRQFESEDAFINVLAFFLPIATSILNLRSMEECSRKLEQVCTSEQLKILKKLASIKNNSVETIGDIKREIASLGGYIKGKHPPGWIVLSRGFEELLSLERGWVLHRDKW